jgi:hypothetical protein
MMPPARGARAVGDALASLEELADGGMGLVTLEFLVGTQVGIGVGESQDKADRYETILHVVEERTAVGVGG